MRLQSRQHYSDRWPPVYLRPGQMSRSPFPSSATVPQHEARVAGHSPLFLLNIHLTIRNSIRNQFDSLTWVSQKQWTFYIIFTFFSATECQSFYLGRVLCSAARKLQLRSWWMAQSEIEYLYYFSSDLIVIKNG
jgi:hypothetical protein